MEENLSHGEWADIRYNYLVEEKPELLAAMQKNGDLATHLQEVDDFYSMRLWDLVEGQMEREGIDDDMKNRDLLGWLGLVNNIRSGMKEVLIQEICR